MPGPRDAHGRDQDRDEPALVFLAPLLSMDGDERDTMEDVGNCLGWPEIGSRMTLRVLDGIDMVRGCIEVERGRYRYAVDWSAVSSFAPSSGSTWRPKHTGDLKTVDSEFAASSSRYNNSRSPFFCRR